MRIEIKKTRENKKIKNFLIEIMLNPDWIDTMGDYEWYPKYQIHMTYAGYIHTLGYIKYASRNPMKYTLTARGKKWLDKQQGEQDGTNE